ncbi:hypothetical protein KKF32_03400 [Patescibacteria group bacterium]|nr:hypothetical protein [Patescibacteria group bacterium]
MLENEQNSPIWENEEQIPPVSQTSTTPPVSPQKKNIWPIILVLLVVIFVGIYLISRFTELNILGLNKNTEDSSAVEAVDWQAVFLSTGQIYFGEITHLDSDILILEKVYYLQANTSIQQVEGEQIPQQNLSLVKLGEELYGPKDKMTINMDHVLFIEELKKDSQVVQAIKRYIEEGIDSL